MNNAQDSNVIPFPLKSSKQNEDSSENPSRKLEQILNTKAESEEKSASMRSNLIQRAKDLLEESKKSEESKYNLNLKFLQLCLGPLRTDSITEIPENYVTTYYPILLREIQGVNEKLSQHRAKKVISMGEYLEIINEKKMYSRAYRLGKEILDFYSSLGNS